MPINATDQTVTRAIAATANSLPAGTQMDELPSNVMNEIQRTIPAANRQIERAGRAFDNPATSLRGNISHFSVSDLLSDYKMRLFEILEELENIQSTEVKRAVSLTKDHFNQIEKSYYSQGKTAFAFAGLTFASGLGAAFITNAVWKNIADAGVKVLPQIQSGVSSFQGAKLNVHIAEKDLLIQHLIQHLRDVKNKTGEMHDKLENGISKLLDLEARGFSR